MLPKDPIILLSVINTKLRDNYADFSALCDDLEVSHQELTDVLSAVGYEYSADNNQFVPKD